MKKLHGVMIIRPST